MLSEKLTTFDSLTIKAKEDILFDWTLSPLMTSVTHIADSLLTHPDHIPC